MTTPATDSDNPWNLDAEEAVIACCVIDSCVTLSACCDAGLKADAFYRPAHKIVFRMIETMQRNGVGVDQITLTDALSSRTLGTEPGYERSPDADKNLFEYIGSHAFLNRITSKLESTLHVQHWIAIVVQKWQHRELLQTTLEARQMIFSGEAPENVAAAIMKRISALSGGSENSMEEASVTAPRAWQQLEDTRTNPQVAQGVTIGLVDVDRIFGTGLHGGQLIVLAARPSLGKSSLGETALNYISVDCKEAAYYVSLEMPTDEVNQNLIIIRSRVPRCRINENTVTPKELERIKKATDEIARAPIIFDDKATVTIDQIRARATSAAAKLAMRGTPLKVIFVDYLQLISSLVKGNRTEAVSEMSRGLKLLAKSLDVPVIAMSQLNREVEKEGRAPRLSDLRESGSIEQDADKVLFIHKEHPDDNNFEQQIIVAKNRGGALGSVKVIFNRPIVRFENFAPSAP